MERRQRSSELHSKGSASPCRSFETYASEENRGRMSHCQCTEKGEEEQALLTELEEEMTKRICGGGAPAFKEGWRARAGGCIKRQRGQHGATGGRHGCPTGSMERLTSSPHPLSISKNFQEPIQCRNSKFELETE
jgi:hypothetical protein